MAAGYYSSSFRWSFHAGDPTCADVTGHGADTKLIAVARRRPFAGFRDEGYLGCGCALCGHHRPVGCWACKVFAVGSNLECLETFSLHCWEIIIPWGVNFADTARRIILAVVIYLLDLFCWFFFSKFFKFFYSLANCMFEYFFSSRITLSHPILIVNIRIVQKTTVKILIIFFASMFTQRISCRQCSLYLSSHKNHEIAKSYDKAES